MAVALTSTQNPEPVNEPEPGSLRARARARSRALTRRYPHGVRRNARDVLSSTAHELRAGDAQDGGCLATGNAIPLHRARDESGAGRRASTIAGQLLFAAALVGGGTVAVALALMLAVVAAPIAAAIVLWLVWRSGDRAGRLARRTRARRTRGTRTRARALGLTVVGS